jgi:iron complex outermembrane recepter protein
MPIPIDSGVGISVPSSLRGSRLVASSTGFSIMTQSVSRHTATAFKPLALALAMSSAFASTFAFNASAQTVGDAQTPVIVTASRFASDPSLFPIGATVITSADIRNAGIDSVNEAIRKIGGVYGRTSFYGTQDFDLDLRGFGTNSSQNLVVMVDGVRMSENELSPALLSSIPIDTVDHIEIMRGGSSVLYGEGATGGVIQIITKRAMQAGTHGSVFGDIGQYGQRQLRASVVHGWDNVSIDATASTQRADNYRANNADTQKNFSTGVQVAIPDGRVGARVEISRLDSGLAGSLTLAQFEADPRQTMTPNDHGSIDSNRYSAFAERRFGTWEAAAELSRREKTIKTTFDFGSFGISNSRFESHQTQFSPRLRNLLNADGMTNELVVGIDLGRWDRKTDASYSQADASQTSKAAYVRDELKWGQVRVAAGVRHENFDKDSVDAAPFAVDNYSKSQSLNAWELQGSYALSPQLLAFANAGQSYRVANVDENGYTMIANLPLDAQRSHDLELGATLGNNDGKVTVRVFRSQLHNEIFYDPTANGGYGANVNLDPTKRQGVEIEGNIRVARDFKLTGQWQHVSAQFTDGPNAGKEMVMVPENIVTARLNWLPADGQTANLGVQWASSQRYGADFDNTCSGRIPSYVTVDGRYAKRIGAWELAVTGSNLADRHYFTNAYGCNYGIYPDSGRQLKLSARYDF